MHAKKKHVDPAEAWRAIPLDERIAICLEEADALIDTRAENAKAENPSVPFVALRQLITNRDRCRCETAKRLLAGD